MNFNRNFLKMSSTLQNLLPIILSFIFMYFLPLAKSNSDYNSIVYTKCTNQTYTNPTTSHSQTLSSLLQQLIPQSSNSKFFKATAGDEKIGVSGFYQCRGDLRTHECYNCVNTFPRHLANNYNICKQAMAGRIQLNGCCFEYETDGIIFDEEERPNHEVHHEICSEKKAVEGDFVDVRDAGFLAVESEEEMWEKGFYEGDYEYVHIVAQCEGDFRGCDCSECVRVAVEIAQRDCGSSFSGKIYLDKCFLIYDYNPDNLSPERKNGDEIGRKVAILLGGGAALVAGFIFLKLMKSKCNKDDI